MGHTKVLLREDVDDLGARGEIVRVKAGYARNYLLPRKLAVEASAGNVKGIEQERAALLKKEAKERATAEAPVAADGFARAGVQTQSRRAGRAVWFGDVDGRRRGVAPAWLRHRSPSYSSARAAEAFG